MVDSSTHLNKLLYVAKKVYSEADAVYISRIDGLVAVVFNDQNLSVSFDPESTTERGRAQLMDIVCAVAKKVDGYEYREYELIQYLASGDREAIINLAAEVL